MNSRPAKNQSSNGIATSLMLVKHNSGPAIWNCVTSGEGTDNLRDARAGDDVILNDRTPVLSTFRHQPPYGSETGSSTSCAGTSMGKKISSTGNALCSNQAEELATDRSPCSSTSIARHSNDVRTTTSAQPPSSVSYFEHGETYSTIPRYAAESNRMTSADFGSNRKPKLIVKPSLDSTSSKRIPSRVDDERYQVPEETIRRVNSDAFVDGGQMHWISTVDDIPELVGHGSLRCVRSSFTTAEATSLIRSDQAELNRVGVGTFPWSSVRCSGGNGSKKQLLNQVTGSVFNGRVDLLPPNAHQIETTKMLANCGDIDPDRPRRHQHSFMTDGVEMHQTQQIPPYQPANLRMDDPNRIAADSGTTGCSTEVDRRFDVVDAAISSRRFDPSTLSNECSQPTFCSCELAGGRNYVTFAGGGGERFSCASFRVVEAPEQKETSKMMCCSCPCRKLNRSRSSASYGRDRDGETIFFRVTVSSLVALLVGFFIFCSTRYQLRYGMMTACCLTATGTSAFGLVAAASRPFRCMVALSIPSAVATSGGRVGLVMIGVACLVVGPIADTATNVREMARAMTCSADVAYNHTTLLLQPFDSLMQRVNEAMSELDHAVGDVERGLDQLDNGLGGDGRLDQLDNGLGSVGQDVENGRLQLYSTGRTCKVLIERAFNQCTYGIQSARDQCLGVIGALGTVYHHARHILDSINPDRWAPKQQISLGQRRRTSPIGGPGQSAPDDRVEHTVELPEGDESDICEPLSTTTVCQSLNDSQTLCQPSRWAGDAIQDAINMTQLAMRSLRTSIHLRAPVTDRSFMHTAHLPVSTLSRSRMRRNASDTARQTRKHGISNGTVESDFYFRLPLTTIAQLALVIGLLLVFQSAATHLHRFRSSDTYGNRYFSSKRSRAVDERNRKSTTVPAVGYSSATGPTASMSQLLPLRNHERQYVADVDRWTLSKFEHKLQRRNVVSGTTLAGVHLLITTTCLGLDYLVAAVLDVVVWNDPPSGANVVIQSPNERRGDVISAVFTQRRSPDAEFNGAGINPTTVSGAAAADPSVCIPIPIHRSAFRWTSVLLPLVAIHLFLILGIVIRARFLRMRERLSGYYFPRRADERDIALYQLFEARRRHLPAILRATARRRHRQRLAAPGICHQMSGISLVRTPTVTSSSSVVWRLLLRCCCRAEHRRSVDGVFNRQTQASASSEGCLICGELCRPAGLIWCRKPLTPVDLPSLPFGSSTLGTVPSAAEAMASSSTAATESYTAAFQMTSRSESHVLQSCPGAFCADCWNDLGCVCPLCADDGQPFIGEEFFDCSFDYCNFNFDSDAEDIWHPNGFGRDVYL